ncbi:MAG: cytochrome c oxidase subunit II [Pyrinomonadaceae bacterium]|nr:cytochrome c oxidase subunit II [Pyrinomonadaceae bacterium]
MQSWIPFLPEQASTVAARVDGLYFYLVGLTLFFTVLIVSVIIFFVVKYRRRAPFEVPRPIAGSIKLETLWSVIPFLIAMSIFVWGASVYFIQYRMPNEAGMTEIYVVGKQWMWKFQHTTGQREINELHVPVGRKVKLTMTTEDVIHSLYFPAFRTKADVVPGRYTNLWFEATKPGRYHIFCAEYCGTNHSGMIGTVVVLSQTDFDNWLSGNANQQSPVAAGQELFTTTLGCASCHNADGSGGRGPALTGLFGKSVQLSGGSTVTADEAYIRESIINPQAQLVMGYQPIMPTFKGQLSEEQLLHLVAYIKSLSPAQSSGLETTAPARSNDPQPGTTTPGASSMDSQRSNPVSVTPPSARQPGNNNSNTAAPSRGNQNRR